MDGQRFDAVAKSLAGWGISRRGALRWLAVAAVTGHGGWKEAAAAQGPGPSARRRRCFRVGRACLRNRQCCSGECGCVKRLGCSCRARRCKAPGQFCTHIKECCTGHCTPHLPQTGKMCRRLNCLAPGANCERDAECCEGICEGFCEPRD